MLLNNNYCLEERNKQLNLKEQFLKVVSRDCLAL